MLRHPARGLHHDRTRGAGTPGRRGGRGQGAGLNAAAAGRNLKSSSQFSVVSCQFFPTTKTSREGIDRLHLSIHTCSLFPVPCSLFPVPCSLFPVPCSLFPVPCLIRALTPPSAAHSLRGARESNWKPARRPATPGCRLKT